MRPCVPKHVTEPMPGTLREAYLQPVIDRRVAVLHKVDVAQEWGLCRKRTIRIRLAMIARDLRRRGRIQLVDIPDAVKLNSAIAHVADLQGQRIAERLLDIEVPAHAIRYPQLPPHPHNLPTP